MSLYDWSTISHDYAFCGTEEHSGPTLLNLDKWTPPSSNTTTLTSVFSYNPSIVNVVMDNCTMTNCRQLSRMCYHCDNLETVSIKNLTLSTTEYNIG